MANLKQEASTDLASTTAVSQTACFDRYHNGIDNGDFTTLTEVSYVIAIIVNSISSPVTVLLNALVITAVKRNSRLQNNANILLSCLAATDLFSGLVVQPSFVFWKAFQLHGVENNCTLRTIHNLVLALGSLLSVLHLSLVTGERLFAIKYAMRYFSIVTPKIIRGAVITVWLFSLLVYAGVISTLDTPVNRYLGFLVGFVLMSCILFILISYAILFCETIRHHKIISTQQLPQDEAERYARENKAYKTTVYVVGALLACYVPMVMALLFRPKTGYGGIYDVFIPWARTVAMVNSLLNPLIYCWRQKKMRKFFLKTLGALRNHQGDGNETVT